MKRRRAARYPSWELRRGPLYVMVNTFTLHRPMLRWDWCDSWCGFLSLSWGDGNADPVWAVDWKLRVPRWLRAWL